MVCIYLLSRKKPGPGPGPGPWALKRLLFGPNPFPAGISGSLKLTIGISPPWVFTLPLLLLFASLGAFLLPALAPLHMGGGWCSCLMMLFMLRSMEGCGGRESGTMAGLLVPLVLFVAQAVVGDVLPGIGGEFCGATASELALPGGLGWSSERQDPNKKNNQKFNDWLCHKAVTRLKFLSYNNATFLNEVWNFLDSLKCWGFYDESI